MIGAVAESHRVAGEDGMTVPAGPHSAELASDLPTPTSNDGFVPGGTIMLLQSLLLKAREVSNATGKVRIEAHGRVEEKAAENHYQAVLEEAKRREHNGGFFSGIEDACAAFTVDLVSLDTLTDPLGTISESCSKATDATINSRAFWEEFEKGAFEVGKWAAVAGSVAVAVASCGSAAPIAALAIVGAVASCAAAADTSFGILERCGVDADIAKWVDVGLSVGGALCSGGAGLAQTLGSTAHGISGIVKMAGAAADGVGAASAGAAGGAHIAVAAYEKDEDLAVVNTKETVLVQARIEKRMQTLLDSVRETVMAYERGLTRVGDAMSNLNRINLSIVRM